MTKNSTKSESRHRVIESSSHTLSTYRLPLQVIWTAYERNSHPHLHFLPPFLRCLGAVVREAGRCLFPFIGVPVRPVSIRSWTCSSTPGSVCRCRCVVGGCQLGKGKRTMRVNYRRRILDDDVPMPPRRILGFSWGRCRVLGHHPPFLSSVVNHSAVLHLSSLFPLSRLRGLIPHRWYE
ncbi:hypothetical protein K435DRAFT_89877 [Dendrothele bispora CBS 962.96]|uniref:Uncharacterized protein n=1 Tax=Dendrothele bispora (strain CBS 962.96) TaxID=1314807 RepID=A0A4S8M4L3_DENBC|nr:hypothetical protein K435DRAFT_89877 [Dendrothele bispora CBS 962.96]